MSADKIKSGGESLYEDFKGNRAFTLMTEPYAPNGIEEAYEIQNEYMSLRSGDSGEFAGYKIAFTTKVMQQRLGATEPVYGRIFKSNVLHSPAVVSAADYVRLGVECEIAVILGKDLYSESGSVSKDDVFAAVESISIAYEIIDSRPSLGEDSIPQSIATNISGAGVVLGSPVQNWRDLDIPGSGCELKLNGQSVGSGKGSDVNGHPVEPMVWIANALLSRKRHLRAGDLVITGSMIPPTFLQAGTSALLEMDNLGSVSLSVE